MHFERSSTRPSLTRDDIYARIGYALSRYPLCRDITFDVVRISPNSRGGNWTVSMRSVTPEAIWEASDIVADIQDAYDLADDDSDFGTASQAQPLGRTANLWLSHI